MSQLSLLQPSQWSVSELTRFLRNLLENNPTLQDAWVQGEISNFSRPASGHLYFTLKDSGASLRCVMWKGEAARMRLPLQDGMSVLAHGRVGVYEPSGQYQLYVDVLRPAGEGQLYQEYLRLKALLEEEGLFSAERKRATPQLPTVIGIVTSATGAALRDMLHTLARRLPLAKVILAASAVQGLAAPAEIVDALSRLNKHNPDVILIARGGGSIEDLWAFNDEQVVRAVAASKAPVISGVGHETDFTLTDFAADLRAPTPTAAAEMATPYTIQDLAATAQSFARRLDNALINQLEEKNNRLENIFFRFKYASPARRISVEQQRLDDLIQIAVRNMVHRVSLASAKTQGLAKRIESLNPLAVLKRGFAVVTNQQSGEVIFNEKQAAAGSALRVQLAEGEIHVRVEKN